MIRQNGLDREKCLVVFLNKISVAVSKCVGLASSTPLPLLESRIADKSALIFVFSPCSQLSRCYHTLMLILYRGSVLNSEPISGILLKFERISPDLTQSHFTQSTFGHDVCNSTLNGSCVRCKQTSTTKEVLLLRRTRWLRRTAADFNF